MSWNEFVDLLSSSFVLRAFAVGVPVALCASVLGVVLVLKRYSMIGHGLSEVGFAALSVALAFDLPPLYVATPVVLAASFVIMFVSQEKGASGDVAIGLASSAALAAGVIVASVKRGLNMDVYNYMFGSILAVSRGDVCLSLVLSVVVLGLFSFFYNRLFLVVHDEDFARSLGVNVTAFRFLISFMTAVTVVLGMRLMGTLLISSLIILPAVTARHLAGSFRGMLIIAGLASVFCFVAGMLVSALFDLPTGASVVAVNFAVLIVVKAAISVS